MNHKSEDATDYNLKASTPRIVDTQKNAQKTEMMNGIDNAAFESEQLWSHDLRDPFFFNTKSYNTSIIPHHKKKGLKEYFKVVAINAGHVADKGASEFVLRVKHQRQSVFVSKYWLSGMLKLKVYEDSGESPFITFQDDRESQYLAKMTIWYVIY